MGKHTISLFKFFLLCYLFVILFFIILVMAAFLGKTEIRVKKTGEKCTVPNNDIAKLMYYFDCVCICIEGDSTPTLRRLRDFNNYESLTINERAQLLAICLTISPDKLIGSVFFPSEDIEGSTNTFLQLSEVSTKFVVAESFVVGGQSKKVKKIMLFKMRWIESNFIEPLCSIGKKSRPPPRPTRKADGCIIL